MFVIFSFCRQRYRLYKANRILVNHGMMNRIRPKDLLDLKTMNMKRDHAVKKGIRREVIIFGNSWQKYEEKL